jgi:hypothetical protein
MTLQLPSRVPTEVRPRPEGGGDFAPALGGGSGANRGAGTPEGWIVVGRCPGRKRPGREGADRSASFGWVSMEGRA